MIITLALGLPKDVEIKYVEAAAAAGVRYVVPKQWGSDNGNAGLVARVPYLQRMVPVRRRVEELGRSEWVGLVCNPWYDWVRAASVFLNRASVLCFRVSVGVFRWATGSDSRSERLVAGFGAITKTPQS